MSQIQLDSDTLNALVAKSIMDSITDQQRAEMIGQAVKLLLVPEKDIYGYSKKDLTPVQSALDQAVRTSAVVIAREVVEANDGLKSRLRELAHQALDQAMSDEDGKLREAVSDAIGRSLAAKTWDE